MNENNKVSPLSVDSVITVFLSQRTKPAVGFDGMVIVIKVA